MPKAAFVGRTAELQELRAALSRVDGGQPQLVVIEGDGGIGKTALLRRFTQALPSERVIWSSGDEAESALDFGVCDQLIRVLLNLERVPPQSDAYGAGGLLLDRIGEWQERGSVVIVLDDFHLADARSAQALLFCLRRLRTDSVLILLTCRPAGLDRLGPNWQRLMADQQYSRHLFLGGLTTGEVKQIVVASGRTVAANAGERLQWHTAGNPLYVTALLAELPDRALAGHLTSLPAPRAFAATVYARMARVSAAARELVSALAVIGLRGSSATAAVVAGLPDVAAAADELVAAGLIEVEVSDNGDVLVFSHPLVRAAVYNDLSPSRRRTMHATAGAVLPVPSAYRHRVAAVGVGGDEVLAAELREVAVTAHQQGRVLAAAEFLQAAATVDPDPSHRTHDLYEAVELMVFGGDLVAASAQTEAIAAQPDSPHQHYVAALIDMISGHVAPAMSTLGALLDSLDRDSDADLLGRSAAALGLMQLMVGADERAIASAELARSVTAPGSRSDAVARQALAWGHAHRNRFAETESVLAGCSAFHRRPVGLETELLAVRGITRNWSGALTGAVQDLTTTVRWIQGGARTSYATHIYASLGEAQFRLGRWDEAARHTELSISLGEDLEHPWYLPYAHTVAAQLYAVRGDLVLAEQHGRTAQEGVAAAGTAETIGYAALAAAHVAWARSDWPGVVAALEPIATGAAPTEHPNLALWRCRLAEAYVELGQVAEARRLLDATAPTPRGGITTSGRLRLEALCQRDCDRPDDDMALVGAAAAARSAGSGGLDDGLLARDYGRVLAARHLRKEAAAAFLTARQVFLRLGAAGLRAECEQELNRCGVSTATPIPGPLALLTPKERVVAGMIARGMTNRAAAAELYVSTKAVEYHLGNIFAKLGINSRQQLRAMVTTADSLG
jgi:DNA-binding CsgD family transcriptional regulator/tetratricopeptide (TPR) repeat protein